MKFIVCDYVLKPSEMCQTVERETFRKIIKIKDKADHRYFDRNNIKHQEQYQQRKRVFELIFETLAYEGKLRATDLEEFFRDLVYWAEKPKTKTCAFL